MHMLILTKINLCTKFKVSSSIHSKYMTGTQNSNNELRDDDHHDHAMAYQCTEPEDSSFTLCKDIKMQM